MNTLPLVNARLCRHLAEVILRRDNQKQFSMAQHFHPTGEPSSILGFLLSEVYGYMQVPGIPESVLYHQQHQQVKAHLLLGITPKQADQLFNPYNNGIQPDISYRDAAGCLRRLALHARVYWPERPQRRPSQKRISK